jgi:hypothetical protein
LSVKFSHGIIVKQVKVGVRNCHRLSGGEPNLNLSVFKLLRNFETTSNLFCSLQTNLMDQLLTSKEYTEIFRERVNNLKLLTLDLSITS